MANTSIKISADTEKLLVSYLELCYQKFKIETARQRYERVDCAIQLEDKARREEIPNYYDDIVMPVVKQPVRKISNFLIDIFVSDPTPFEMVSGIPENADAVKQFNTVLEENAKTSKWARELVLFFKDLPKYNIGMMSCEWVETELSLISNASDITSSAAKVTTASRAGNVLKRLDVYNTFYDTTVAASTVADQGDFIGYIEQYTSTRLHTYLANLKRTLGIKTLMNEKEIFNSNLSMSSRWYRPKINTVDSVKEELTPMQQLFQGANGTAPVGTDGKKPEMDPAGLHEIQILYVRLVPSVFGMDIPSKDQVTMLKLHILNWKALVAVEKITNAHNVFPVVMCQIDEEGIEDQVKSAAEMLMPNQNLQTKLYDARLKGLNRNINDRALYNSARIDKKHMESNNPSAKIPVKPNILNPGIEGAYKQIPFQDNLGTTMLNELGFLNQLSQRTSGLNDPQQGMFQKGNKTLGEFNEVMSNADDDLRTWAKLVETQAIAALKYIIKINTMQFQAATSVTTSGDGGVVAIDPLQLRSKAMEFKMADGLISKDTLMDMNTARGFFDLLLQSPQLQAFYGEKLPQLVEYIFTSVGFDTKQFAGSANPAALTPPAPTESAAPAA